MGEEGEVGLGNQLRSVLSETRGAKMVKVTQTGRDCLEQYSWWKNRGLWPVEENNECGRCLIPGTNQELRPKGQNCGAKYTYIYICTSPNILLLIISDISLYSHYIPINIPLL